MKKSILIFCCFSLLSLGAFLNYEIQTFGDDQEVNLGFVMKNANASWEDGNGGGSTCLYNRNGAVDGKVYCATCLLEDDLWDSGYNCSN